MFPVDAMDEKKLDDVLRDIRYKLSL